MHDDTITIPAEAMAELEASWQLGQRLEGWDVHTSSWTEPANGEMVPQL